MQSSGDSGRSWSAKRLLGRDYALAYLLIAPSVLVLLGLIAYPFLRAMFLALQSQPIGGEGKFVGLQNYTTLLNDPVWWLSFRNTLVYAFFGVGLKTIVGLAFALCVCQCGAAHFDDREWPTL